MTEAWIIDGCRTPRGIGKPGKGALSGIHPQHLGATVLKALAERNDLNTAEVDDIIWGTSSQRGQQGGDLGRMAALDAGYDIKASAVTLDRFCGSGITSVNIAASSVMSGMEDLVIAGGTEMMSTYGQGGSNSSPFMDSGNERLRSVHPQPHQGVCADAIATLENISREDVDKLALVSQENAAKALEGGHFDKSLVPVYKEDGSLALDHEEFPRPNTTLEGLSELKASFESLADYPLDEDGTTFRKLVLQKYPDLDINHVHHAGNSSGVVDGAAALLLTSPDYAKANGMKPRAKVRAMANMGDSPTLMLNAPVPAAKKVLDKAGLTLEDIDLFEVNEAVNKVRAEVDSEAELIIGAITDPALEGKMRVSIVATALDNQGPQTKPVVSMVHRIHNRNVGYSNNSTNTLVLNQSALSATEGATVLDINASFEQDKTVERQEQTNESPFKNISMENATYLQNTENIPIKEEYLKKEDEILNFEVDSIELANPQLFSDDEEINTINHENKVEKEPEVFESQDSEENSEIKEPEMFEHSDLEDNLEIPAFLRRQKN